VRAVLVDLGGVLVCDLWPGAALDWGPRLSIEPSAFLSALFSGHEEAVLIGNADEPECWQLVARRLDIDRPTLDELGEDLARREVWDRGLDAVVLSCEVGVAKPDEKIYAIALERAGVGGDEAIFVDDVEVNVAAARRLGLAAHRHVAREDTIEAIDRFLAL
jgi:putative hydrolase of the HAD superfamily